MTAVALHHEIDGPDEAPPVLLLGSLGSTLAMWEPQVEGLAGDLRLIRADLRGHGASPTPPGPYAIEDLGGDAVALLDRLELERAHLVGLSLGGMIAQWVAAHHPERVDRLALLATSTRLPPPQQWHDRAATARSEGTQALADAVVSRWFTAGFADQHPARVERLRRAIADTDDEGYAGCCEAIAALDLTADLTRITASTLVLAAADDPATPPPHGEAIVEGIADARLTVVDDAAHLLNMEQAQAVNDALRGHLLGR